jgi:hypothetical protein
MGGAMDAMDARQVTSVEVEHLLTVLAAIIARLLDSGDRGRRVTSTEDK